MKWGHFGRIALLNHNLGWVTDVTVFHVILLGTLGIRSQLRATVCLECSNVRAGCDWCLGDNLGALLRNRRNRRKRLLCLGLNEYGTCDSLVGRWCSGSAEKMSTWHKSQDTTVHDVGVSSDDSLFWYCLVLNDCVWFCSRQLWPLLQLLSNGLNCTEGSTLAPRDTVACASSCWSCAYLCRHCSQKWF